MQVKEKIYNGMSTALIDSNINSDPDFKPEFVYNDAENYEQVLDTILKELKNCDEFFISVAFITEHGLVPLLQTLKELELKGVKGKILTTDYLTFNDPKALRKLNSLNNVEIKMYRTNNQDVGFHTKGYIFHNKYNDVYSMIIGSSNLTISALKTNKEWNTKLVSSSAGEISKKVLNEFNKLWNSKKSLKFEDFIDAYENEYNNYFRNLKSVNDLEYVTELVPNSMQQEFINNVVNLINEGVKKALLISSTGTGKTYASAFLAQKIESKKILFIVHREQIAKQALMTFRSIFGSSKTYGILSGNKKDNDADFIFATMQTISKEKILNNFIPDYFDLIIIDECHHAGAKSYEKIMEYFNPKFMLGMTASPDTNQYDIYQLFDHNIAYEIRLQDALEQDLLCPFHYFGITDLEIDDNITNDNKNFNKLIDDKRVDLIIEQANYYGYSGDRVKGLIFCSSIEEANVLSIKFNERGLKTAVLTGKDSLKDREEKIQKLTGEVDDHLDYIFTVDIFNEGVDIPEINQVIMLRPTQSPVVFIQQLGRGLRKNTSKEYVVVLDFIGNYENNFMIPIALFGDRSYNKDTIRRYLAEGSKIIPGCSTIHFDEISRKRIYDAIDSAKINTAKQLQNSYFDVKQKLGKIPNLVEYNHYAEISVTKILSKYSSYYEFIEKYDKEFNIIFSQKENKYLSYLSKQVACSKRIHDSAYLKYLIENSSSTIGIKNFMLKKFNIKVDEKTRESVINNLTNNFLVGASKNTYKNCKFIDFDGENYILSNEFSDMLKNKDFKTAVMDILEFGMVWNQDNYKNSYKDTNLCLYEKYSYEDVCRLLNWKRNESATIGGYKYDKFTKTMPVFINYNKEENAINYEDRFISKNTLIALSKSPRKIDSKDADAIYRRGRDNKNNRLFLFVRKNKEGENAKEFYFLGEINAIGEPTPVRIDGKNAFEITYKLDDPVRTDIFDYIVEN